MRARLLVLATSLSVGAACSDQVELAREPVWATVAGPLTVIGDHDGAPEEVFDRIRAVRRFSDGAILVADGGSQQLRVYNDSGAVEGVFGGIGSGPGEFQYLKSALIAPGDSIIAYDARLNRLSTFDRSGRLVREGRLPGPASLGKELIARLGPGEYLFAEREPPQPEGANGLKRGRVYYVRHNVDEEWSDTIASLPGAEMELHINSDGSYTTFDVPFGRDAFHAAGRSNWYAGANDEFNIARFRLGSAEGKLQLEEQGALSADEVVRTEAATIARIDPKPSQLRSIQRLFREVPIPDQRPAHLNLMVDQRERLWAREWFSGFAGPASDSLAWRVFDRSGHFLGRIMLPSSFEAYDTGDNWVLGVEADSFDVQRVVLLSLEASS